MIVIVDTNILISALIKDSTTRKIIVESEWDFCYPEISFHEIRKYRQLVLKKSGMDEEEYNHLLSLLLKHIRIIPDEFIYKSLTEAAELLAHIDPDDVVFLSAAISYGDAIIWSDDAHFDKQNRIKNLKTKEIVDLFYD